MAAFNSLGDNSIFARVPASALDNGSKVPWLTHPAESAAIFGGPAEIDPQVQKSDGEGRAQHRALNRQKRPEDAGIVELPHPQPFLQIAGNACQNSKEQERRNNQEPHRVSGRTMNSVLPFGLSSIIPLPICRHGQRLIGATAPDCARTPQTAVPVNRSSKASPGKSRKLLSPHSTNVSADSITAVAHGSLGPSSPFQSRAAPQPGLLQIAHSGNRLRS